jgi:2-polyprenyl-3-methyl-5-hydroxy-6-metoxy-1,4-benzoquinol methylase
VKYVNGIPWPKLPIDVSIDIPLREEYLLCQMDYLDTPEASIIFETQCDIIQKHNYKGIVDVGCRHGPVNDILHKRKYTDYNYMGFDTSSDPIDYAKETWKDHSNIEYRVSSWNDLDNIHVDFEVDCIIWSGVLLYVGDAHMELFKKIHDFYRANGAIIQEPCYLQPNKKWLDNLELNTIEDELYLYGEKYFKYEDVVVDADIFAGRRRIANITLYDTKN